MPPVPLQPPWLQAPDDVIGGEIADHFVLTKNDWFAVVVSRIVAYPVGFSMNTIVLARPGTHLPDSGSRLSRSEKTDTGLRIGSFGAGHPLDEEGGLELTLHFADGSSATAEGGHRRLDRFGSYPREALAAMERPPHPLIDRTGGSYTSTRHERWYWVAPLPPPGPLKLVIHWPAAMRRDTELTIDAGVILDAARRADRIWDR